MTVEESTSLQWVKGKITCKKNLITGTDRSEQTTNQDKGQGLHILQFCLHCKIKNNNYPIFKTIPIFQCDLAKQSSTCGIPLACLGMHVSKQKILLLHLTQFLSNQNSFSQTCYSCFHFTLPIYMYHTE